MNIVTSKITAVTYSAFLTYYFLFSCTEIALKFVYL